ncbi:LysR substrate-binding domain-containing protein [Inquilinus sp.]|uniref:LysR substrate-binding domain-containing protein n=1 Tax=Inquilinus sp. TaxID=1932117 RepID=UPI0031D7C5F6
MVRDLDLGLLRTFATVVEARSVSGAADRLARTQAAVSMQLRRLEEDVGQRLLDRSPRGIRLTGAGETLLRYAHRALGASEEARRVLAGHQVAGTVRLGLLEDVAVGRLPRALARFSEAHPRLRLELVVDGSQALEAGLRDGGLDLAIGDPGLIAARPLARWHRPLHWVAARSFGLDPAAPLPLVAFAATCLWQERVLAALDGAGRAWRIVCTSHSTPAIQAAVEAGLGVSVLLDGHIREAMRVVGVAEGLPPAPRADFGLYRAARPAEDPAAVQSLQDFLAAELEGLA